MANEEERTIAFNEKGDPIEPELPLETKEPPKEQSTTESPATPPKAAPTDDSVDAGIKQLREQLKLAEEARKKDLEARERAERETAAERAARAEAERRAHEQGSKATEAYLVAEARQLDAVQSALKQTEAEEDQLRNELESALQEGKFSKVAKTQAKIAKVASKQVMLEEHRAAIEGRRQARIDNPPQPAIQPPVPNAAWTPEQYDMYINSRTPKTASWLRQNTRFASDPQFRAAVGSAHDFAVNVKHIQPDTDDYFKFVEESVGLRQAALPASATETPAPVAEPAPSAPAPATAATATLPRQAPRTPAPAAPPSMSIPASSGANNKTSVTLTKEERDTARILFPKVKPEDPDPEVIYARQKLALIAEGKIGPGATH